MRARSGCGGGGTWLIAAEDPAAYLDVDLQPCANQILILSLEEERGWREVFWGVYQYIGIF
jgi:hypothetical protein